MASGQFPSCGPTLVGILAGFPNMVRKETEMSKAFTCRDIGMDCDWNVSAETEGELLLMIGEHLAQVHEIADTPPDLVMRVREAINDEPCQGPSFPGPQ